MRFLHVEELTEDEWKNCEPVKGTLDEINLRLWESFEGDKALSMREALRKAWLYKKKRDEEFSSKQSNNRMAEIDKERVLLRKHLIELWKFEFGWLCRRLQREHGVTRIQCVETLYGSGFRVKFWKGSVEVRLKLKRNPAIWREETEEQLDEWLDVFDPLEATYDEEFARDSSEEELPAFEVSHIEHEDGTVTVLNAETYQKVMEVKAKYEQARRECSS